MGLILRPYINSSYNNDIQGHTNHLSHNTIESTTNTTPTVSVEAIKDAKDGYNINIITTNFVWAPEHVNQTPIQGEGHAHIYVDNIKIARVYSNWFHLSDSNLHPGKNTIVVTLNANDHSEWMKNAEHIQTELIITK